MNIDIGNLNLCTRCGKDHVTCMVIKCKAKDLKAEIEKAWEKQIKEGR